MYRGQKFADAQTAVIDGKWRAWRWDGAHPHEIDLGAVSGDDTLNGRDSRGYYLDGDPNITLTVSSEPGGQCQGCPRCKGE